MQSENISLWLENIGFVGLGELVQILIAIVAAFISEDATLLALALLEQANLINSWVFWLGGFFGIIIGDAILYAVGRLIVQGRQRLLWLDLQDLKKKVSANEKSVFVGLMLAQFFPGSRFPAYLSAGISKYPFGLFLLSKAIVLPVWLYLFLMLGEVLILFLQQHAGLALLTFLLLIFIYLKVNHFLKSIDYIPLQYRLKAFYFHILRYRYFEFWPAALFYWPVVFYIVFFAIKYRNGALPAASNPMIEHGGWVGETKSDICDLIPTNHFARLKHAVIKAEQADKQTFLAQQIKQLNLSYPIILKPEKGLRGDGVCLTKDDNDVENYIANANYDVLIQEYCDYQYEAGIFYVRYPNQTESEIFSITDKIFPYAQGDGQSNLMQLILNDKRARYIASTYLHRFKHKLSYVLEKNQSLRLAESGNHAQGVEFTDGMKNLYTPALHKAIDNIVEQLPEFYIGRFDIRYQSVEKFREGTAFKIIEINGAGAEATHIYDRNITLLEAYKVLFKQFEMLYEIGALNVANGTKKPSAFALLKTWWLYLKLAKNYQAAT